MTNSPGVTRVNFTYVSVREREFFLSCFGGKQRRNKRSDELILAPR